MNYLAHALPFFDRPYFVAGTATPDWLTVADRPVRLRRRHVETFIRDGDQTTAELAAGIAQHFADDVRFHANKVFAETALELTGWCRDALGDDTGFQPAFLGHLLTEVLLDAALIEEQPGLLAAYYEVLDHIEPGQVEAAVNRLALRPTQRLAPFITLFLRERILYDYPEDAKLMVRLNQIMRRVGMDRLPEGFAAILPAARRLVAEKKTGLLDGIPMDSG